MKKRSEDLLICVGYNCLSATLCYILLETTYYFFHVEAFVSPIVSLPGYPESMMSLIVGLPVLMQSTCSSLICIKFRPQSSKEREYVMHSLVYCLNLLRGSIFMNRPLVFLDPYVEVNLPQFPSGFSS